MTQTQLQQIEAIAAETAERHGAFLTELVLRGELRSKVLEVYVDTDEGITIDTVTDISRDLSAILDEKDLILGGYRLDVSSPDLSRPIRVPRQYKKNIGRVLSVTYMRDGAASVAEGTLESASDESIVVRGDKEPALQIPLASVQKAFIVPQLKKHR